MRIRPDDDPPEELPRIHFIDIKIVAVRARQPDLPVLLGDALGKQHAVGPETLDAGQSLELPQSRRRHARVPQVERLETLQVGQRREARIGDVGPFEVELGKVRQATERGQSGIRDRVAKQRELYQIGQSLQVDQPCVGDIRTREEQSLEFDELSELGQAGIADLRAFQVELLEVFELRQRSHAGVLDRDVVQRERPQIPQPFEMNQTDVGDPGLN